MSSKHYCVNYYKVCFIQKMCVQKTHFSQTNLLASGINVHCSSEVNRFDCFCDPLINLRVGYLPALKFSRSHLLLTTWL